MFAQMNDLDHPDPKFKFYWLDFIFICVILERKNTKINNSTTLK